MELFYKRVSLIKRSNVFYKIEVYIRISSIKLVGKIKTLEQLVFLLRVFLEVTVKHNYFLFVLSLIKRSLLFSGLVFFLSIVNTVYASTAHKDILQAANKEKMGEYVRQRFLKKLKKPFNSNDKRKKIIIMGDSHAQDFYNAMIENNLNQSYQISTRRIPAICGLYLGLENINHLIEKKHLPNCQKSDTLSAAMPQIKQADVVIIAANWKLWSAQRLSTTISNLKIKAPQKLFIIGRKDFGKQNLRKYLRLSDIELKQLRNPVYETQRKINKVMREKVPSEMFVNIQDLICKSEKECSAFTPQARLISFDGGHLTQQGARYIGKILLQNPPLNQLQ